MTKHGPETWLGEQADRNADAKEEIGASPTHIVNPELRREAWRAFVWASVIGAFLLAVYISQSLLVIFGAMVFASMIDGGSRLLGRVLPIGRTWRVGIVLILTIAVFVWLGFYAGTRISQEAAALPNVVGFQLGGLVGWLQEHGFAVEVADLKNMIGSVTSGVGMVTSAIGGILGGFTTMALVLIIGIYLALEPLLYERGVAWMVPKQMRGGFHITVSRMAYTLRRLMAGRLVGMAVEGLLTYALLAWYGVPMAALLGILVGLLAFIPNIGAVVSGVLMVLVGFSGGRDMGLYTLFVYFLVQNFDGYIIIPLIAKKTVDLAPALVLGAQLIMGILFGILGLFLADPMLAMIKVALERRAEHNKEAEDGETTADGA